MISKNIANACQKYDPSTDIMSPHAPLISRIKIDLPVKPLNQCGRCLMFGCTVPRIHCVTLGHATHSIEIWYREKCGNYKFTKQLQFSSTRGRNYRHKKTRYPSPMNATVTQSDPKTVNYEDVFRTARRKCLLLSLVPRCCFLLWMSSVSCKDPYLPMHTFLGKTKKN